MKYGAKGEKSAGTGGVSSHTKLVVWYGMSMVSVRRLSWKLWVREVVSPNENPVTPFLESNCKEAVWPVEASVATMDPEILYLLMSRLLISPGVSY